MMHRFLASALLSTSRSCGLVNVEIMGAKAPCSDIKRFGENGDAPCSDIEVDPCSDIKRFWGISEKGLLQNSMFCGSLFSL